MASEQEGVLLRSIQTLFGEGTTGGLTDPELLDRFLARSDEAAFEALVVRHGPMVLDVCRNVLRDPHDAEDAFQATFLILTRNARWVRKRESLASWLFGVALRVARRARGDAARRRDRERKAGAMSGSRAEQVPDSQTLAILHEEVGRMPEKYREPVVLCYLEGLTYEAAARRMQCPLGTVSVRLMRAKERLRGRLIRRGVAVPAGLIAAGVAAGTASAAIPELLVESTVSSAVKFATGKAAAGVVSESVSRLVEGVMSTARWKAIGASLLGFSLVVVASAACLAMRTTANDQDQPEPKQNERKSRRWLVSLQGGEIVELVGVSSHPSGAGTWWAPDGRPLAVAPYAKAGVHVYPDANQQAREFAVRVRRTDPANNAQIEKRFRADPEAAGLITEVRVQKYKYNVAKNVEHADDASLRVMERRLVGLIDKLDRLRHERYPEIHNQLADEAEARVTDDVRQYRIAHLKTELNKLTAEMRMFSNRLLDLKEEELKDGMHRTQAEQARLQAEIAENGIKARSAEDRFRLVTEQLEQMKADQANPNRRGFQTPEIPRKATGGSGREPRDHQWLILPSSGMDAATPLDEKGAVVPEVEMVAVTLPKDRTTCTVRFGIASGAWKTRATGDPGGGAAFGLEKLGIVFGDAHEVQGKTELTVSHSEFEEPIRVVAVDDQGRHHLSSHTRTTGARGVFQLELRFDVALAKVKEFRFQTRTRSFEWAEFADVSLNPKDLAGKRDE